MSDRIALHTLEAGSVGLPDHCLVAADEYSWFKHGDGAAAVVFGRALAERFQEIVDPAPGERIFVTSSGYGAVPPAARALVAPFVARMRVLSPELELHPLRVHRLGVSPGDYATMSTAQRELAVGAKSMHVDPRVDVGGARVVSLDDIRVTGTHELAMDGCLGEAGASWIDHLYVVDAYACADAPELESVLNRAAVQTVSDLLAVVAQVRFVPNARFAKRVVTFDQAQQEQFVAAAPAAVTAWILDAAERDGLSQLTAYAAGVRRLHAVVARARAVANA